MGGFYLCFALRLQRNVAACQGLRPVLLAFYFGSCVSRSGSDIFRLGMDFVKCRDQAGVKKIDSFRGIRSSSPIACVLEGLSLPQVNASSLQNSPPYGRFKKAVIFPSRSMSHAQRNKNVFSWFPGVGQFDITDYHARDAKFAIIRPRIVETHIQHPANTDTGSHGCD